MHFWGVLFNFFAKVLDDVIENDGFWACNVVEKVAFWKKMIDDLKKEVFFGYLIKNHHYLELDV